MPCYTEPPSDRELTERRLNDFLDEIGNKTPKTEWLFIGPGKGRKLSNNEMAKILCAFLKERAKRFPEGIRDYSLELQIWWRDHQKDDARHEREVTDARRRRALQKSAMAKLTPDELKALKGE